MAGQGGGARLVRPVNVAGFMADVRATVDAQLLEAANQVKAAAADKLVSADRIDSGELLREIREPAAVTESDGTFGYDVISAAAHSIYVELGRRPGGKPPPHSVIHAWVKRRLGLDDPEAEQAAWAIAKSIAERGIPGTYFMRDGAAAVPAEQLSRDITAALRRRFL